MKASSVNVFASDCWLPPRYEQGIYEQRIAICCFGHRAWSPNDATLIQSQITGQREPYAFFECVPRAFEYPGAPEFWQRALFFRFATLKSGGCATARDFDDGWARSVRIIERYRPQKLFVFSRRAWGRFPLTNEAHYAERFQFKEMEYGTYTRQDGNRTDLFALRDATRPALDSGLCEEVRFAMSGKLRRATS